MCFTVSTRIVYMWGDVIRQLPRWEQNRNQGVLSSCLWLLGRVLFGDIPTLQLPQWGWGFLEHFQVPQLNPPVPLLLHGDGVGGGGPHYLPQFWFWQVLWQLERGWSFTLLWLDWGLHRDLLYWSLNLYREGGFCLLDLLFQLLLLFLVLGNVHEKLLQWWWACCFRLNVIKMGVVATMN